MNIVTFFFGLENFQIIYLILVKVVLASGLNQIKSPNYLPVLTYFTRGQI